MSNLTNLDTESLVYFIENKISPQECEKILLASKQKSKYSNTDQEKELEMELDEDLIIFPPKTKNLYSTN